MDVALAVSLILVVGQTQPTGPTDEVLKFLLGPLGLVVFLLTVVVWGGRRRWWVFGGEFTDMRDDRDFWRELAVSLMSATETSVKATEILAGKSVEQMAREVEHGRRKR